MVQRWDDYAIDVAARRLFGPDGDVHTEPQVFDVLAFLINERERVVTKEEILDAVWGDQFVSESALTTRIKQARKALGDSGRTQKYIRNVHGRGYQFVGAIADTFEPPAATTVRQDKPVTVLEDLALDIAVDDEFPFVGRTAELDKIDSVLKGGATANAKLFIGGAPGSGKSRLAIEVLQRSARSGATVCVGRCEASVTSGLQAIRDAFGQLATNNPSRLAAWCHGVEGQLLSLIPSLVNYLPHEPIPVDAYAGIDVFLTAFERAAAEGPVLILIDDIQWSDEPTRILLSRLHRRLRGQPVATLATFRSGRNELPADVDRWISEERRTDNALQLTLAELDPVAATALITAVTGSTDELVVAELMAKTGGHSLFLTESLRDLQLGEGTASSVNELINKRLARQDDQVQQIIQTGAILGSEFSFSVAAAASGLNPDLALGAIDAAIDAELLHETGSPDRFRFSHQLVPKAIVDELTRARRASLHAAAAQALRDQDADDVEVAFHLLGAIPLVAIDEAIALGREAAVGARDANQFDRAIRVLEAILATEPQTRVRAEVLLEIGEIINNKGTPALALGPLEQVADTARRNGWPDLFVSAALAHWNQSPFRKPSDTTTLKLLAEADDLLGDTRSVKKAQVMAKTAVFNVFRQPLAARSKAIREAMAMADQVVTTDNQRLRLLEWAHITFSCPAGAAELAAIDPQLDELRASIEQYFSDAAAPETGPFMQGDGDELRRVTRQDDVRMAAQPIAEWRKLTTGATFAAFEGDIDDARDLCDRAAQIGQPFWGESSVALHGFGQFFLDLVSDDWSRSKDLLELLVAFGGADVFDGALAAALHANGDEAAAAALVADTDPEKLASMGEHILGGNGLVGFAEAAIRLDDDALATAVESALSPFENLVMGVPWAPSLAAADPLARLAARRGDTDAAERYAGIARTLYASIGAPKLAQRFPA